MTKLEKATFKIMTKDEQWTIKDNLSEKEAIEYWKNNVQGNISSLDRIIQDHEGNNDYDICEGKLEKIFPNWY